MLSLAIMGFFVCRRGFATSPYSQLTWWPPCQSRPGRRCNPQPGRLHTPLTCTLPQLSPTYFV